MGNLIINEETYVEWISKGFLNVDGVYLSYKLLKENGDFDKLISGETIQKDDDTIELDPSIPNDVIYGVKFPTIDIYYPRD